MPMKKLLIPLCLISIILPIQAAEQRERLDQKRDDATQILSHTYSLATIAEDADLATEAQPQINRLCYSKIACAQKRC